MNSRKLKLNKPYLYLILGLVLAGVSLRAEITEGTDFDERPVPVKAVPPVYPPEMLRAGTSGLVSVTVLIDEKGDVVAREIAKSTRREFEEAALTAVKKWKFKPAKKAGAAVKARMVLPIQFTCEE